MSKALWNGTVLAESDTTIVVEGNHYFPPDSVNWQYFQTSKRTSTCPWKGQARYYSIEDDGKTNADAAWTYPKPKAAAAQIAGYVAFWRGIKVVDEDQGQKSTRQRILGRS
ncbi:MAG: DUF427 domain-containing protein [Chloroflexi bacterium]|nr:DUF427 domain-containing protein [Chloroflexota bacterium]